MSSKSELALSSALWEALPSDISDASTDHAAKVVVVAAFLDLLSEKFGMSDEHDDELTARASAATLGFPVLAGLFDSEFADPEQLRDLLYRELIEIVRDLRPERSHRLLTSAQVYWALSWDEDSRPLLPFRGGESVDAIDRFGLPTTIKAIIGVSNRGNDFALLRRSVRVNEAGGVAGTSGRALTEEAAGLAVLIARRVVSAAAAQNLAPFEVSVEKAPSGKRTLQARTTSPPAIRADGAGRPSPNQPPAPRHGLRAQAQDYEARGQFVEASATRSAIVEYLRRQSEAAPGDHEAALAAANLESGVSEVQSGHVERAEERFSDAIRISEVLVVLEPSDAGHRVRLAAALTMLSELQLARADIASAIVTLRRSVSLSRDLADDDDDHEDLLAASLTMLGMTAMHSAALDEASDELERACKIARKTARRVPDDLQRKVLLANTLATTGLLRLQRGDRTAADEARLESAAVIEELDGLGDGDHDSRWQLAGVLTTAGSLSVALDQHDDATGFFARAESIATALLSERPRDRKARFLLATSLFSTALTLISTDEDAQAVDRLARAVEEFETLESDRPSDNLEPDRRITPLFGTSLMLLGEYLKDQDRRDEAEAAWVRATVILEDATTSAEQEILEVVLRVLAELYEEDGRELRAQAAREHLARVQSGA